MKLWPFKKKVETVYPSTLNFTQLDMTETCGPPQTAGPDDWVKTSPILASLKKEVVTNLPPLDSLSGVIYERAAELSSIREEFDDLGDGAYCPICHIANVDGDKVAQPCPKCSRPLLAFGWN